MTIKDWPKAERPRERVLRYGINSLSDAELLAVFFRTGSRGKTAVDLARDAIMSAGGSLGQFLDLDESQMMAVHGIGVAKYVQIQAGLELGRRYLQERLVREGHLTSPAETRRFLAAKLKGRSKEVFACLFLDKRHKVIRFDELFHGSIDGAAIYPRDVVKLSLKYNASAVIFAHNHPSGKPEPSYADKCITERLVAALDLVDIEVLDHIVIGDGEQVSFAERGWL